MFTKQFVSYKRIHVVALILAQSDGVKQYDEISISHNHA